MVAGQSTVATPAIAGDVAGNDRSILPGLAFWARNMVPIRAGGWTWPGFDYSDVEWRRLLVLAKTVSPDAFFLFQAATALLVLAEIALVVGIGGGAIVAPLYQMIPPDWALAGSLGLLVVIPAATFLLFGYGFPLAMRIASALAMNDAMRAQLSVAPGDASLAAKIPGQFRRMAAFIAGILFLIVASELYLPDSAQHWAALVVAIGSGIVAVLFL
jgi:hypothetical protein